jgi:hypothetical protein
MGTKLVELIANRVVERRNMMMTIQGRELAMSLLGRVFSLSFSCSLCFGFEHFLALLCHFPFRAFSWPCGFLFF